MFTVLRTIDTVSPGANTGAFQIWSSGYTFNKVTFFGWNAFNASGQPVPNASGVYVGLRPNELPFVVPTGSSFTYEAGPNRYNNLANFYMGGRSGDGVYIIAE